MLLLVLSAVGLFVAPEIDKKRMVNTNSYPVVMLRANKSVFAEIEAIISPDGEMEKCTLVSFFGDEQFAKQVCSLINKRMWKGAQDTQGHPVYSRVRTSLKFAVLTPMGEKVNRMQLRPDLEAPLPIEWEHSNEVRVPLAVLVGENGHAEACILKPEPLTDKKAKDLADLACQKISQKTFSPIDTRMGPVQRYIATQEVRFSRSEPKPTQR
jgi:hypothetical protein